MCYPLYKIKKKQIDGKPPNDRMGLKHRSPISYTLKYQRIQPENSTCNTQKVSLNK